MLNRADVVRFGAVVALALLLGLLLQAPGWVLAIALAGYGFWQYRQLGRLLEWVRRRRDADMPDHPGVFEELCSEIDRLRERHKRRKKKLTTYLKQFQRATAALPDATIVLGEDNDIRWANAAAARLLNIQWPQDAGQRVTNLVRHPLALELLQAPDAVDRSVDIGAPDSEDTRIALQVVPYGNEQRLLIARDITRLHRLNQIRSDFVANVSHELRTPLTVFSGYLETLETDEDNCPPAWRPALRQMREHVGRMHEVITDLLLLSRLEQEDRVPAPEPVAVPEMIAAIHHAAQRVSGERRHLFRLEIDTALWLRGAAPELHSALSNLVMNAVQYTPERGVIRIRWWADADGAHFAVQDTGPGIPPQHIPRLTERFYRVDTSRARDSGGTGLGLAIVKHVLARHGATLQIESEVGSGSTFTCHFPTDSALGRAQSLDSTASA
ncbi:MAG: phosphate regulon sensor histidine kinase PhoR [Gammaproteobacteria bacterium]